MVIAPLMLMMLFYEGEASAFLNKLQKAIKVFKPYILQRNRAPLKPDSEWHLRCNPQLYDVVLYTDPQRQNIIILSYVWFRQIAAFASYSRQKNICVSLTQQTEKYLRLFQINVCLKQMSVCLSVTGLDNYLRLQQTTPCVR